MKWVDGKFFPGFWRHLVGNQEAYLSDIKKKSHRRLREKNWDLVNVQIRGKKKENDFKTEVQTKLFLLCFKIYFGSCEGIVNMKSATWENKFYKH